MVGTRQAEPTCLGTPLFSILFFYLKEIVKHGDLKGRTADLGVCLVWPPNQADDGLGETASHHLTLSWPPFRTPYAVIEYLSENEYNKKKYEYNKKENKQLKKNQKTTSTNTLS